jgi:hypothetical protein
VGASRAMATGRSIPTPQAPPAPRMSRPRGEAPVGEAPVGEAPVEAPLGPTRRPAPPPSSAHRSSAHRPPARAWGTPNLSCTRTPPTRSFRAPEVAQAAEPDPRRGAPIRGAEAATAGRGPEPGGPPWRRSRQAPRRAPRRALARGWRAPRAGTPTAPHSGHGPRGRPGPAGLWLLARRRADREWSRSRILNISRLGHPARRARSQSATGVLAKWGLRARVGSLERWG